MNLPTHSSLSMTLDELGTYTTVEFIETDQPRKTELVLNGHEIRNDSALSKVDRVLNVLKENAGIGRFSSKIQSRNNIPTAAGLASSASGLAALTLAAYDALSKKSNLDLSLEKLSTIARLGSGSACRSLFGGFVRRNRGQLDDGSDSAAIQVAGPSHWDFAIFLCVTEMKPKKICLRKE